MKCEIRYIIGGSSSSGSHQMLC